MALLAGADGVVVDLAVGLAVVVGVAVDLEGPGFDSSLGFFSFLSSFFVSFLVAVVVLAVVAPAGAPKSLPVIDLYSFFKASRVST